jgi:hypothetical protein
MGTFSIAIRHAKISSDIARQLSPTRAHQMSTYELIETVSKFDQQLRQLLEDIPAGYRMPALTRPKYSPPRLVEMWYLHFSIYGSLIRVHSHFFYPWISSQFIAKENNPVIETQISWSSHAVAEAARQILLTVRHAAFDGSIPTWLGFHYPIYAHIHLFIYILKYPNLPNAGADVGLLDVCTGHFSYLEFLTSAQLSLSLPRETAILAAKFVKAERAKCPSITST